MDNLEKFKLVFKTWCEQGEEYHKDFVFLNFHPVSPESKLIQEACENSTVFYMSMLDGNGKTYSPKFYNCEGGRVVPIGKAEVFRLLFGQKPGTEAKSTLEVARDEFTNIAGAISNLQRLGMTVNSKDAEEITRKCKALLTCIRRVRSARGSKLNS